MKRDGEEIVKVRRVAKAPKEEKKEKPIAAPDPKVLTVSKKAEGGGRYRTISDALDAVKPGLAIRVLDDADYEEQLVINREQYRDVVLEATGKATLRKVWIQGVPGFILRGFRVESSDTRILSPVNITGRCPGVVLDRLDMKSSRIGIRLDDVPLSGEDPPIVIQNCTIRSMLGAVVIIGHEDNAPDRPRPCGHVVIRNNILERCSEGVVLHGATYKVFVVGNRVRECAHAAIDLRHPLAGTADVLIANNTLLRNGSAIRLWHDSKKGKAFLGCKHMRIQNNLVLDPPRDIDLLVNDHRIDDTSGRVSAGDVASLLKSAEWRFSHNWREIAPPKANSPNIDYWIPARPNDRLQIPIEVLSRKPGDPDFLRPAKDSPLAKGGVGDPALPPWVGAVPPEGAEPWDWGKTWEMIGLRLLTVSKKAADGGRFRTINNALDKVEPGMTIRVLDNADYEEYFLIDRPEQYRGVILEATGKATLRKVDGKRQMVRVRDVPDFVLRGFRLDSGKDRHIQVVINGTCPGVLLDRLEMTTGVTCVEVRNAPLSEKDAPIVIQNCTMRSGEHAIFVAGQHEAACGPVVIRNNTLGGCGQGVILSTAVRKAHVVGNLIFDTQFSAVDCWDLGPGTADVLIANNTLFRNGAAPLRVWDDHDKGKDFLKCKNVRIQNNLILEPPPPFDLILLDHSRGKIGQSKKGDVAGLLKSPQWHFSHNWREFDADKAAREDLDFSWIPARPDDRLEIPIRVLSRRQGEADFLRPAKDSPLGKGGAGADDPALPRYVGAIPPVGVEPWDWDKTWKAMGQSAKAKAK